MSTEVMTKDGQFIVIPNNRSWGKMPNWSSNKPSSGNKGGHDGTEISFVDIMNEQLAEKMEEEEFENYIKETYVTMSNEFVNLESDQQYSILLKSCLDQELNQHVLELDEVESEDETDELLDEGACIESTFFKKIHEHLSKHHPTRCQDTKQRKRCRTKSQGDIDSETRMTLYKFMNKSVLKESYGIVNKGKKSLILHAEGGIKKSEKGDSLSLPKECAIKVFKPLITAETKDAKNENDNSLPESAAVWAHREFQNLKRLEKAGIPCPKPLFVKKSVLVMGFVGKDSRAAWKLQDFPFANEMAVRAAYDQVIHNMKTMYKTCHLVHSDLSQKSILWWDNQCYFTDVAHALEAGSNNSYAFLYRNCRNIVEYFGKKGLKGIHTMDSLFKEITGFEFPGVAIEELKL